MKKLLFFDFEVFKKDWLVCIGDIEEKKMHTIINNRDTLEEFYNNHKDYIWIGFNSRHYDQYILKGILAGLDPYYVSREIVENDVAGWSISKMMNDYPLLHYDCKPSIFSLKKHEAFMGSNIKESSVSFDIDRKLTEDEILDVIEYCKHDVRETYKLFLEIEKNRSTFESHMLMLKEFNLPIKDVNKTPTRLTAQILGASKTLRDDEFDIDFPESLKLGKYEFVKSKFNAWAKDVQDYKSITFIEDIAGVAHSFGVGGLHGAIPNFVKEGIFLMIDVASYYPALMIEYNLLSRNCKYPEKYKGFRDERVALKKKGDNHSKKLSNIRKIPLNGTYGATKDKNNPLYDPRQANNICIIGQCFLVDLIDKLDGFCKLIQSNTDGILVEVNNESEIKVVEKICKEWSERTLFELEIDKFTKIIQRDVNNYIAYNSENGTIKTKGSYKKRTKLDNNLAVVNEAIINYYIKGIPIEYTINNENELIKFQMVSSIGKSYKCLLHNGEILGEKTVRFFASKNQSHTAIFKRRADETNPYKIQKLAGTPTKCFIDNGCIVGKSVPEILDKDWYISYTKYQLSLIEGEYRGLRPKDFENILSEDYKKGVGSDKKNSKNYNPNREADIMYNMIGKVIDFSNLD